MNARAMEPMPAPREPSTSAVRRTIDSAVDVAGRAGAYLQARMGQVSARAQDLARDADVRVERITGKRIESWTGDARRAVREHPLRAVAVTIGLGYVLGKLLTRRG